MMTVTIMVVLMVVVTIVDTSRGVLIPGVDLPPPSSERVSASGCPLTIYMKRMR
jgi:hypothetical protein